MATCDTNTLLASARTFSGLTPGMYYPVKLALLARWLKSLNPAADTSVAGLLNSGNCFTCLTPGQMPPFKLALLCDIAGGGGGGSAPAAPLTLSIDSASNSTSVVLHWTQGSAPDNNEVWVSKDLGLGIFSPYALLATVAGGTTTYTDLTGMGLHDFWVYKVRAVTGGQPSSFSPQAAISNSFNGHADFRTGCDQFFPVLNLELDIFDISASTTRTTLNFAVLKSVGVDLIAAGCPNLVSISAPALTAILGSFDSNTSVALVTITANALVTIGGSLLTNGDTALTTISMSALMTLTGGFIATSASLITINFASLKTVGLQFSITNATSLTSLSIAALQTVGGELQISNSKLTAITLTSLTATGTNLTGDDFTVTDNLLAISMSTPVFATLDQSLHIENNGFTSLSFPVLNTAADANVINNASLTSLSFGNMAAGFQNAGSFSNNAIVTLTAPNVVFADNGINVAFNGNAMNAASVNLVLARCRASGDTTNIIDTSGGTNAAPTGQGITDKAFLITAGNTVTTN